MAPTCLPAEPHGRSFPAPDLTEAPPTSLAAGSEQRLRATSVVGAWEEDFPEPRGVPACSRGVPACSRGVVGRAQSREGRVVSKGALPASPPAGLPGASEEHRGREAFSSVPRLGADPRRQPWDQDAPCVAGRPGPDSGRLCSPRTRSPGDDHRCSRSVAWSYAAESGSEKSFGVTLHPRWGILGTGAAEGGLGRRPAPRGWEAPAGPAPAPSPAGS